jgi:hypothetical protein
MPIDYRGGYHGGKSDWGVYQRPGNLERMQTTACTRMLGCHLIPVPAIGCSRNSRSQ